MAIKTEIGTVRVSVAGINKVINSKNLKKLMPLLTTKSMNRTAWLMQATIVKNRAIHMVRKNNFLKIYFSYKYICHPTSLLTQGLSSENPFAMPPTLAGSLMTKEVIYYILSPPLIDTVSPVINPELLSAKNATTLAISSGNPRRLIGICEIMASNTPGEITSVISVFT